MSPNKISTSNILQSLIVLALAAVVGVVWNLSNNVASLNTAMTDAVPIIKEAAKAATVGAVEIKNNRADIDKIDERVRELEKGG